MFFDSRARSFTTHYFRIHLYIYKNGAYADTCSATYKPLAVDTSDEVGMARMKINYLELTADENLYVKLKGCPAGTIPPSIKYIYTQNCNKHEMGEHLD